MGGGKGRTSKIRLAATRIYSMISSEQISRRSGCPPSGYPRVVMNTDAGGDNYYTLVASEWSRRVGKPFQDSPRRNTLVNAWTR